MSSKRVAHIITWTRSVLEKQPCSSPRWSCSSVTSRRLGNEAREAAGPSQLRPCDGGSLASPVAVAKTQTAELKRTSSRIKPPGPRRSSRGDMRPVNTMEGKGHMVIETDSGECPANSVCTWILSHNSSDKVSGVCIAFGARTKGCSRRDGNGQGQRLWMMPNRKVTAVMQRGSRIRQGEPMRLVMCVRKGGESGPLFRVWASEPLASPSRPLFLALYSYIQVPYLVREMRSTRPV